MALRVADTAKYRAETRLNELENAVRTANSPEAIQLAEEAKSKAVAKLGELQSQLEATRAEAQKRAELTAGAREAVKAAEADKAEALEAATEARRKLIPVSILVSRKTQRLYVRQAFQPVFESPVSISDLDHPIGTHVYTALDPTKDGADLRWSAVSVSAPPNKNEIEANTRSRRLDHGKVQSIGIDANASGANAALDRVSIPRDALDRISELLSPGSSLIISDEGISSETGNGTDFVILMSGEPQGGIKMRHREPEADRGYDRVYRRSPYYERSPYVGRLPYYGRPYGGSFFSW
jgi:hypothetical protein